MSQRTLSSGVEQTKTHKETILNFTYLLVHGRNVSNLEIPS